MTKKQLQYQSYIDAARAQNKSLAAYAKAKGINVQCLYSEIQRQRRQQPEQSLPGFVRVADVSPQLASPTLLQVRLPNGVSLAMPAQEVSLEQMLTTLARL